MRALRTAALAATMILGIAPSVASAAELLINNADFETNGLADGRYLGSHERAISGWTGGGSPTGLWNPGASSFSDHAAHANVLWTSGASFFATSTGMIRQTVADHVIKANTRYTLTVDVGNRGDATDWGYQFGLIAGDALSSTLGDIVLASMQGGSGALGGTQVPEGTFRTLTLIFETGASGPAIGQLLTLGFSAYGPWGPSGGAAYDNIHLDASPLTVSGVPEPATWAMMISGFGLVGGAMRRRRHAAVLA